MGRSCHGIDTKLAKAEAAEKGTSGLGSGNKKEAL
jgi:hypothetical protein